MTLKNDGSPDITAYFCVLTPCVRTYNASVSKTILTETLITAVPIGFNELFILDSDLEVDLPEQAPDTYLLATRQTLRNGSWENCSTSETAGPGLLPVGAANIDSAFEQTLPSDPEQVSIQYFPADCVWRFNYDSVLGLRQELFNSLDNLKAYIGDSTPVGSIISRNVIGAGANLSSMNELMQNLSKTL